MRSLIKYRKKKWETILTPPCTPTSVENLDSIFLSIFKIPNILFFTTLHLYKKHTNAFFPLKAGILLRRLRSPLIIVTLIQGQLL